MVMPFMIMLQKMMYLMFQLLAAISINNLIN